jgi:hypothetical protein
MSYCLNRGRHMEAHEHSDTYSCRSGSYFANPSGLGVKGVKGIKGLKGLNGIKVSKGPKSIQSVKIVIHIVIHMRQILL